MKVKKGDQVITVSDSAVLREGDRVSVFNSSYDPLGAFDIQEVKSSTIKIRKVPWWKMLWYRVTQAGRRVWKKLCAETPKPEVKK